MLTLRHASIWMVLVLAGCASAKPYAPPSGTLSAGTFEAVWGQRAVVSPSEALLVVNDSSPTSVALGKEYVNLRHVQNVVHVQCIDSALNENNETIQHSDFVSEIERPILNYLKNHAQINFILLTRGVPIRVAGGETGEVYGGQAHASLDDTIAAFGYDRIPGAVKVRFRDPKGYAVGTAWLNRYWNKAIPFEHATFGGYLVTRLDGYSLKDARALTTRALSAEARLGHGPILLDIEPDFGLGNPKQEPAPIPTALITAEDSYDTWNADMERAGAVLSAKNVPVDAAVTEKFVGHRKMLLGYFSWGSNDDHFSQAAYNSLGFAPGAIGDTAVSTSARSFFVQSGGQSMIADLITQGITGVKGYTDEPLLQGISSPTIVLSRFTSGFTLAESFYAGSHFVGWTDLVVGDPLTQPYARSK
jgi:uncharacterized protein (TIGR03790 family)